MWTDGLDNVALHMKQGLTLCLLFSHLLSLLSSQIALSISVQFSQKYFVFSIRPCKLFEFVLLLISNEEKQYYTIGL